MPKLKPILLSYQAPTVKNPEIALRLTIPLLALMASAANGQDLATGLASCGKITSDLQRLICFDALVAAAPASTSPPAAAPSDQPAPAGKWQIIQETNPMDDSQTVILVLPETGAGDGLGRKAELYLRCRSATMEAFISWQDYLASDGGYDTQAKDVTLRWDSDVPATQSLSTSTDATATFLAAPASFYKSMLQHQKLVAQVIPYNAGPRTAVFELPGLKDLAAPLRKACALPE